MAYSKQKQWWAPVWTGLVMDAEAKHYRKMKNAIWLFLYLLLNANRRNGVLMRKVRTISKDMGITRDTTLRWLKILRIEGYIVTLNTGRYLSIQIKNWKGLSRPSKIQPQNLNPSDTSNGICPTVLGIGDSQIPVHLDTKTEVSGAPNDSTIKNILKNDNRHGYSSDSTGRAFKSIGFCAKQELLAWDLVKDLEDPAGINLYRSYSQKYPERLLRRVLSEVKEIPDNKIKKGRGALFNFLVQQYAKEAINNSGC